MICCCSLAGTQACKNCLQYIEHFGKQEIGKNYIIITQTGTPSISETIEPKRGEHSQVFDGEVCRKRGRIMGTNYYAVKKQPTVFDDGCIHIGKSSAGWKFLFHDCEWFHTFPQVKKFLEDNTDDYVILDEYDEQHSIDDFLDVVAEHQKTENKDDFEYGVKNIDGYRFREGEFC